MPDYTPVDPYEPQLARLRAATCAPSAELHYDSGGIPDPYFNGITAPRARDAATHSRTPAPRPTEMPLDANGVPDPYLRDLEKLRSANR